MMELGWRAVFKPIVAMLLGLALLGHAEPPAPPAPAPAAVPVEATLFRNVRIFDGTGTGLSPPSNVLVVGNTIKAISRGDIAADPALKLTVIEGGGRTLMPGLIDAHTHLTQSNIPLMRLLTSDIGYVHVVASRAATDMLMRGFTSARENGGPSFGLKQAIDEGLVPGPRIWPAGATITQTAGHGDFRMLSDLPWPEGQVHASEKFGFSAIADGVDLVRRRTREQLMQGATHIKLMASGGVSSLYDPLDVRQYSEEEIRAAVDAASAWGTYVTVHAYTPEAIQASIRAGVKQIDHGQLADEATAQLMAEKGIWWGLQPFIDDEDAIPFPEGSANRQKQLQMVNGTDNAYRLAKKYRIKTAFGTDTLFDARLAARQGRQLAKLVRWYTPAEALAMATGTNGELLQLSGPRNPYPGRIGVVAEGALADLLLVNGDPTANIRLIEDPARNFLVIMKDGQIYKNTVPAAS